MPSTKICLPVPRPFELHLCLFGHGWIDLPPHAYDEATATFTTVLRLGTQVVDARLRADATDTLRLELESRRQLGARALAAAREQIAHMLRLDDDLGAFHAACRDEPRLAWVARRGAGRLLRSASVFEDLVKLLFTTNTTWAGTKAMTRKLIDACGEPAPSGRAAFPTPAQSRRDAAFYRDTVRTGYRAEAARALAQGFADGALRDDDFLRPQPGAELRARLLGLCGFGPYATGQAMRLFGHYEELALDSWCRARLAELAGRRRPPSDGTVARRYARFRPFQGLALWMDLTASWHGEGG
jgi:N-glycosylase/DNA lyase